MIQESLNKKTRILKSC